MSLLGNLLKPQRRLFAQQQQIKDLQDEVNKLKQQNDSMKAGMRRCVTCDYRIDFKQRQANQNNT